MIPVGTGNRIERSSFSPQPGGDYTARYGARESKEVQQQLADQLHHLDLRLISIENQAPGK